jgi:uncharacterized SAM-binding protein YcdF (DUF218 family)
VQQALSFETGRRLPTEVNRKLYVGAPKLLVLLLMSLGALGLLIGPDVRTLAGELLVRDDGPARAQLVVVLGGDFYGSRMLTAGQLVVQGYTHAALLSGPVHAGMPESDLAIRFLEQKGYPKEVFISFPHFAKSTIEEAAILLKELRRRHTKEFLLVTSSYHSRRAGIVYRMLCLTCRFRVIAAPEADFQPTSWWRTQQGGQIFQREFPKLLASPLACLWRRVVHME